MPTISKAIQTAINHQNSGRFTKATEIYQQVLGINPHHPDAWHLWGLVAYQTGDPATAIDRIRRAISANPNAASFHNSLGSALQAIGQLDDAVQTFREAIRLNPDYAEAHYNMANALMLKDNIREAALSYEKAVSLNPHFVSALSNYGNALKALGKLEDAKHYYERALKLNPNHAEAHSNLGSVLLGMSRAQEAETSFQRAVQHNPRFARAYSNLGGVYQAQGKLSEAIVQYEKALAIDPDDATPYQQLGGLAAHGHYQFSAHQLQQIRRLIDDPKLQIDSRRSLHLTLAFLAEREEDYDLAFEHYRQMNELRQKVLTRRGVAFDPSRHRQLVDDLISILTPEFFQKVQGCGLDSRCPVFVMGMARSGTTLVEQILASHPDVFGAGERKEIGQMAAKMAAENQLSQRYPLCLLDVPPQILREMAARYLALVRDLDPRASRIVDKMPANHNNLGFIAILFPNAAMIHCRRDPRDVCLSAYFQDFESDLAAGLSSSLENLAFYYWEYERLMVHWREVLPQPMLEIRYEDLVRNQESKSRELVDFIGLQWDERCLRFHETARTVQTASKLQVRKKIYTSSVNRWKHYEKHLGPLRDLPVFD